MFTKVRKDLSVRIVLVLVFFFGCFDVIPAQASTMIYYVKWDASGANDGASWTDAYTDLQSALATASIGDEIWVAAGVYKATTGTDRLISFTLKDGVAIYGGFSGMENLRGQRNWELNITTLSGDIGVDGIADNSYHVVIGVSGAILDGFTITGGNVDYTVPPPFYNGGAYNGGGMLNISGSSPSLANLIFSENTTIQNGGGMANLFNSSPLLTNVIFVHNKALGGGGGMYSQNGSSTLYNVVFENNEAYSGGGLETVSDNLTLTNVTFSNNKANTDGGGMFNSHGSPTLTNVTFSKNSANRAGGGMSTDYYNTPVLNNVTFADNTAGFLGGGIDITNVSEAIITNAIFWNNSAPDAPEIYIMGSAPNVSNSIIQGGCPVGVTCNNIIDADPKLGSLADNGGFTQTMALGVGSPAIDTGGDANCPETDQRGVTRSQGSHCDIGTYEVVSQTMNFLLSSGAYDGWILESSETSNKGGTMNTAATTLSLGDNAANKQYRVILSFDTSALPVGATITSVTLEFKYAGKTGTLPFNTHGNLLVDIQNGSFKGNPLLQLGDFNMLPSKKAVFSFNKTLVNGWYSQTLINPADSMYINLLGVTQFRLRFTKDDNNDFGADLLKIYSGNAGKADRPRLVIEYYIP